MDHMTQLVDGIVDKFCSTTIKWPVNPLVELSDDLLAASPVIWVNDYATKTHDERGIPVEDMQVVISVQKKIDTTQDEDGIRDQVRNLLGIVSDLEDFCRETPILVDSEEVFCIEVNRERSRNILDYNNNGLFYAEFIATYRIVAF